MDTYFEQEKTERKMNRKWIDAGILLCIVIAGAIAVDFNMKDVSFHIFRQEQANLRKFCINN